ncbi:MULTISPECIES: AAA family ATPase [Pseudanabaena]|uniref:AAA family ATPase n=1 Tax=Pseudanabaena TaxID=1152 RepID=UPI00247B00B8|nr:MULTISPECIES: ATP-binding protein [Pseudanabaena]MEA5486300.1 ATP-binding protein [Pseudanabaena sp. CCNP1317]WGS71611.1 ATP-binding protein [Pseudanabaena galeata CCNP1313]
MSNPDSNTNQPRLLSFTLDGWSVLGGRVTVSLHDGVAVLVGLNGAGKSSVIEGFEAISLYAIGKINRVRLNDDDSIPKILEIEVLTPTVRLLKYNYELITLSSSVEELNFEDSQDDKLDESQFSWNDRCQYADGAKELVWTTEYGMTTFHNMYSSITNVVGSMNAIRRSTSLKTSRFEIPDEMQWLYSALNEIHIMGKTSVRKTSRRRLSQLRVSRKGIASSSFDLVDSLAQKIFRRMGKKEINELEAICQRIGLGRKITIQKFVLSIDTRETLEDESNDEYIASVLLDGVNIGLLSDGTLRVLSILMELLVSSPSSTIIIEEPETQIHPAMLSKLLNEIETYTYGQNLIISTHSPQVVAWTSPEKINLVHRKDGQTFVSKLGEDQIHNVIEYLSEEGDLGEWIYSGILDDE